jgi:hypothetical protein
MQRYPPIKGSTHRLPTLPCPCTLCKEDAELSGTRDNRHGPGNCRPRTTSPCDAASKAGPGPASFAKVAGLTSGRIRLLHYDNESPRLDDQWRLVAHGRTLTRHVRSCRDLTIGCPSRVGRLGLWSRPKRATKRWARSCLRLGAATVGYPDACEICSIFAPMAHGNLGFRAGGTGRSGHA